MVRLIVLGILWFAIAAWGGIVLLDMPELQIEGDGEVVAIEPCPAVVPGDAQERWIT